MLVGDLLNDQRLLEAARKIFSRKIGEPFACAAGELSEDATAEHILKLKADRRHARDVY